MKGAKRVLGLLLALCLFFAGGAAFQAMGRPGETTLYFTGAYPDTGRAKEILESCRLEEEPRRVCFLWDGGLNMAENQELGRNARVRLIGLLGDGALYHWKTGCLAEEDDQGCVISEGLSVRLFGSRDARGSRLRILDKEYVVRETADWRSPAVVIRPGEQEVVYTSVRIGKKSMETKGRGRETFLMGYGLSGLWAGEEWLFLAAYLGLFLFPGALAWDIAKGAARLWRQRKKEREGLFLLVLEAMAFSFLVFWLARHAYFPQDWIPGKWSDFGFWQNIWRETAEEIRWYVLLPKWEDQAEHLFGGLRTLIFGLASWLLWRYVSSSS